MSNRRCNPFLLLSIAAAICGAGCKEGIISGGTGTRDARAKDAKGNRDFFGWEDLYYQFPDIGVDAGVVDAKVKLDGFKSDLGCAGGTTACMGGCVDLQSNFNHCGACGAGCVAQTATSCSEGKCSCGSAGSPCSNGLTCVSGDCKCVVGGGCAGCCIGNSCVNSGAPDPANACRVCQPSSSTSSYTDVTCVTTLAGTGTAGSANGAAATAQFNSPSGLLLSGTKLYVADQYNFLIRLVEGGQVSNFAGSGVDGWTNGTTTTASFSYPESMVLDGTANMYVADRYNYMIRMIAGSNVTTFAGTGDKGFLDGASAAAKFDEPRGVAVDASGNLLIADAKNNRIRLISKDSATVSTFAGTGTAGLVNGPAASAQFKGPTGLAVSGNNIYVADCNNHAIRLITLDGQGAWQVSTLAGTGVAGMVDGSAASAKFFFPTQLAVDSSGKIYVADSYSHRIRRISGGQVSTFAGSGTEGYLDGAYNNARFKYPGGVAVDSSGKVYVADTQNHRLRLITP